MALDLKISSSDDKSLVELIGDLDIYTSPEFNKDILKEFNKNKKDIIFDASGLDYIDSTGLGAFISLYKTVNENGKTIKIIGIKQNVKKIFTITELDKIFRIED